MVRHLTDRLTRLARSGDWSLCLDLLRRAVTGKGNASWTAAAARLVVGEPLLLLQCVSQPCAHQGRQATEVLLLCNEALRATFIAAATPSQPFLITAGAGSQPSSPVDASPVKPAARGWQCVVPRVLAACATPKSIDSGDARRAPRPLSATAAPPGAHLAGTNSHNAVVAAITHVRTGAGPLGIAVDPSLVERARRRAATAERQQGGGLSRMHAGTRGPSAGHALRVHRTGSRTPTWSHSTTYATRAGSTRAAASTFLSSFVDEDDERRTSRGHEPLSPLGPSSWPQQPRVTRRLAAAWQRACAESYRQAHAGRPMNAACRSSRCTWAFAAEEELRAHFQRALRWRSDAAAPSAGDEELVAEAELRSMAAFVVETYVSLRKKPESGCRPGAALMLATRNSWGSSELQWQLLVLLVLADEVCAALGDSAACSMRASHWVSGVTEFSAVYECIIVAAAAQLCVLRHARCQRDVAGVAGADTRHGEADAWEATAVAPHTVHVLRATRRLVEGVLAFCTKQDEGAILPPTRTDASDVCSLNSWLGGQLCCLAETSCCSLHPARGHRDQRAALPEPPLLLLRLLVQSASWDGHCAAADVNGAQHLRHVCAAVLLIEHVLERASEDTLAPCIDEVRGALWLSRRFACGDEGAGDTVRQRTRTPRQGAWRHSRSSNKDARIDGGTAALAAATGRFVCQVLDGCPPSISRLLLLPGNAPQLLRSTMGGPATPLDRKMLADEVVLLAPGMALSAAWRLRHACAVGPLLCTSPTASAPAVEHADATDAAGARDGAASKCSGVGDPDSGEHSLLLRRRDALEQVWSRLCPSSTGAAAALLPAWWQALSSQFFSSILSQLDPPAIARVAEATLETLRRLPPLLSAVHHEERARARRCAGAARLEAKAKVCGGAGEGAGVAQSRSAVLALQCMLASAPTDAARVEASQALLSRLCTALTANAQSDEEDNADLTAERVHGAGVCLVLLLACASTSFRDQAAATHNFLAAVTSLVDSRGHPQHGRRESNDVYSALRSWWPGAMGSIMLARHAQLARGASRCAGPASTEHGSGEESRRNPLASLSPAAQLALWWEEQSSLQADSAAPLPLLRDSCYWTGMRVMRLCNTAAHLAATSTTTSSALSSSQLPFLPAPSTADAEAARVACTAVYDMLSLEHVCHLAIASAALPGPGEAREAWNAVAGPSSTAAPSPHAAHSSCACALATADAGVALFKGDLSSGDRATSIFTHVMTAAREARGGALNVLQHRQGRLLNDRQHESLVEAMRDFSKRRCVKEAVALFYAHERQYRRLRLAEVELFAETAKRAPLPFLVRLLLYVPPPCESAVLARAIIAGAWKAYQRALHRHSRQVAAAAAERRRGSQRENAPLASGIHRQSCRRVEQAWYESLAVARRALALLPSAGGTDGCDEEAQRNALALLQRFLCARPRSMQTRASPRRASSSSTGATVFADEWDSDAVQSAQLLAALLPSPSPSSSSSGSRQRLHVLRGVSARGSVAELYQAIQFCDANNDPATAVRAYLRFANAHATSPPPSRLSRASAQDARKRSSPTVKANDGRVVPLLSLDTCVTLLRLASMHVVAACDEDAATYGVPVTASSSTRVPLTALLTYVEAHHVPSELSSPEASTGSEEPRGGAVLMQNALKRNAAAEDAEMTMLPHMRAALEESAAAPSDIVAEAATAGVGSASKPAGDAMLGDSGYHAHVKGTPACAVSAAAAATSRAMTYATNCIAAVQRLSPTLPASLRCVLHSDSAAIPLTAVLHDALRWCRLRPQSVLAREGAATAVDGLDAAALHSLADRADSDDPATADVVARLLAAVFQLDGAEMAEMVDAAHPRPMHALVVTAAAAVTAADVAPAMADVAEGDVTSSVLVTRHTFACRAARANQDFWCLVRHSDALLSYVWDYLWELYRLESTVLWVSPAQQQRAYLAVAECAQVILAALQALDVWAAEMRAHEAPERVGSGSGSDGDGDYQAHEQASLTGGRSRVPMAASSEWRLGSSVDEWRAQLRSGILQRVHARLFDEGDLPDVTSGHRGETASTMLPCSLSSSGMADTTSAAIAYMTTVMQHSSRAFESCAPTKALMQLAGDPIAATSPAPSEESLSGSVMRTEGATSPREVRELLSRTTQQYYDALSRLVSPSLPVSGGAGPLRPVHLSRLAMDSLSYVLRCVTATAAAAPPRRPHTIGTVAASEAGGTTALLSRVAAAEGMLRHVASLVQHASVLMEATDAAPRTAGVELLRTLWCLSGALQYAATLLDECTAWWTLLDLEAAAAPASELRGASDASSCDVGSVFPSVNGSLVARSALTHVRAQLERLVASFADLYASGWCSSVHARLPEVTRARLWSRGESRAQHLRVCLVLQHLGSVSGDAAVPARLVRAAEALQQALARYPSSLAAFTETKDARALQQSGFMDLDELVDGDHHDVTESVDCTAAATVRTLERTLLAYLTRSTPPEGVLVIAPGHMTAVPITALEASFQRAVMTCLSPSHAALLWRLFTALLDDGCHPSVAVEDTEHEGSHDVPRPMRCERDAAAEGSLGVMCAVPTTLWRQLQRLGQESESDAASDVLRSSGARTEAPALHSERLAVHAALLSRHPLVVMGVVRHPLVRHHQLAEARREQWPPVQVGADSGGVAGTSQAPSCEWLKKLLLYGEEDDSVAEARAAASDDAGESALSSAWTAAGRTLSRGGGGGLLRTSSAGALALLPAQPLRERFVSALILAVLCDASLMCDGPSCAPVAFVSSSVAAAVAAQRRECMLLELVQHLGYVAPHAVRTACRWITCTPYPPAACAPASSFPADASPPARLKCSALSCTDATTLRRLRVALLSCGPWPTTVERTLLEYAARVQRAATQEIAPQAHAGDGQTSTMPFPEALELYQRQQQQQQPESKRHNVAEAPQALMVTAQHQVDAVRGVRDPLLQRVLQHYVDQVKDSARRERHRSGSGSAAPCGRGASSSPPLLSTTGDAVPTAHARGGRFVVGPSRPLSPAPTAPSSSLGSTRYGHCTGAGAPLSAIQLACEEGARLVKALRTSTAPAVGDAAARIVLRMRDLATAPSHPACVGLLSDAAFATDLMALPTKRVAATVMLAWRTLLVRAAELDCREQNWDSAGGDDGVVAAELHNRTRNLSLREAGSRDRRCMTVLDVYAMLFLVASRVCDRLTAITPPLPQAKGRQWLVRGQRQLGSLKRELAAYWVAVLADEVMASQSVFQCSATSEAEAIRARIDAFCRSGADGGATRSPTLGLVTLEEHLRRAQARLQAVSQEPSTSSSFPRTSYSPGAADDKAAAELSRLQREASAQLRDAGAWLTSLPRPVTAEVSPRLAREAAHASPERAWSLWPPAASETYRIRACLRKSCDENTLVTVTVRNPVSVVAYLCASRREHASAPQTRRPGARAERRQESARTATVRPYDVRGATCVLLPAVCLPSSAAAQGSRQPGASRGRARWASQGTAASLADVWRAADGFVWRGCLVLACVPRGGHGVASRCGPARGSAVGAVEMDSLQDEVDSTATGTSPAGAGVVMQALLGLVSLEDARLQQEQRQQQPKRQHAGLRSQSAVSDDKLQLLFVLRRLRQRLLSLAPAAAATTSGAHGTEGAVATVTAEDKGDPVPAESPWAVFMPLSCVCGPSTLPARRGGERGGAGSAWHSYLHVLHLCGDGLLCRVEQRRGRRASSSAAALTRVTHQLQRLASLSALEEQATPPPVSSAFRSRLLNGQDAQRIICFQLRGLQHVRDHVGMLGWTMEQHREVQLAQQSIVATVAAICALQHRSHHGQQCLQREDGWDAAATARIRLSTRARRQVTAVMHEGPVHPVEQATAVCFYPGLAHLLRQLSVTYPPGTVPAASAQQPSSSRQRSPVEDRVPRADDAAAEVVTEFAGVVAASARRRHRPLHPRAPQTTAATATAESDNAAAALLATVYGALCEAHEQQRSGPTDRRQNTGGAHTSTTPALTPVDSCGELHALLSAVVAAVQRRSRDADPWLLLEFLSGNEREALLPLAAAAEASYLETLMKAVALGASAPLPNDDSHRVVEAGLTLYALLHPWLPLSASAREMCAMEAALSLVTLALPQRERLDDKRGAGTTVKSSATSLWYLVQVVLVSILHHQQPTRLSVRSLVLLGVIYSQLRNWKGERGGVLATVRSSRTAPQADANVLLWRILSALSALSEKDAAEVRDAWMSRREVDVVARGPSVAEHAPARATDGAALTSVAENIRLRTETGGAKAEVCSGAHVIEVLYHGSLQALGEDGSGGGATEQVSGRWKWPLLLAATRLRTWLACEDVTAASPIPATTSSRDSAAGATLHACTASRLVLPQLCVLEEALCGMLKGMDDEAGGAGNRSRTGRGATSGGVPVPLAVRRGRLACLRAYTLYAELKRTCSAPLWRRQQGCLRSHARNGDSDSSRHDNDRSRRDCVGDVASLVLELTVVAALSAADASPHSRHSGAVSDAHQLALLSAFVRCCDALGTPLPSPPCPQPLPRWGRECSLATPAVAPAALPRATGLGRVGVDAHAAVRHLATTLLFRLAEDAPLSAPSARAILHDWRAVLTPLQALRRVASAFPTPGARLPAVDAGADVGSGHGSVWLLSTSSAGLQWAPVCQADPSSAKLAGCLDVSSSDVDSGDGDASQPTGQQLQPQSQRRHCHHDQSLQGLYYTTLRLLWRRRHLAKLPLPVLLKELLRPLAELERAAAETSTLSPTATEAAQRAVRPTVRGRDDSAAGVNRKTANRLTALVDVAQQLSMHPVLSASAATAAARGGDGSLGTGWTSACLVFKLLAQIEAALRTRCGKPQGHAKGGERAACAETPCVSPSHAFAARYADLLAQRGTCAPDYLAFMLVVSRHCPELLPPHGGGAPGESEAHEERRRLLRHAQLRHAVALAAPPPAVGAVMELFQLRTAHCRRAMAAAQRSGAPTATGSAAALERNTTRQRQRVDGEEGIGGEADGLLGALTPDEQTLLQRLHHLLQTSRGKAAPPLRGRRTK